MNSPTRATSAAVIAIAIGALFLVRCTTISTSTGPSPAKCQVSVPSSVPPVAASGGAAVVNVSAQPECAWSAVADVSWIADVTPPAGQGDGQVEVVISPNATAASRQGNLTINGTLVGIAQEGVACRFSVTGPTAPAAASGAAVTIGVTAAPGCVWTASTSATWLTPTSSLTGSGQGSVTFSVAANPGAARSGPVTIAGETIMVSQNAVTVQVPVACVYTLAPTSHAATATGGPASLSVTTTAACAWTASSGASWITITSGVNGTGSGSVAFSVAANTGAQRTGTMTIAGQTYPVTQSAPVVAPPSCTYTISPSSQSLGAGGGAGTPISVSSAAGCAWTATSNDGWLRIVNGASGTGDGVVTFTATANAGAARQGTLTIAGRTFAVNQAAACTYSINPTSRDFSEDGGTGTTQVTAPAGCSWTAVSNTSWITVTAGTAGSGNGTVTFRVATNPGNRRTGSITIAGTNFSVVQSKH